MAEENKLTATNEADAAAAAAEKDAAAAKAEARAAKGAKGSASKTAAESAFKAYKTKEKHTYPIDIQIHNELICGQWMREEGIVEFSVPSHLVEGFEKHYHFTSGNIVAAE